MKHQCARENSSYTRNVKWYMLLKVNSLRVTTGPLSLKPFLVHEESYRLELFGKINYEGV